MKITAFTFFTVGLGFLTACHEQSSPATTQPAADAAPTASAGPQCYAYTSSTDTIRLTLRTTQPTVTGELAYRYFEKDRNQGTISGTMHGDTLLADYTFQSEGVTSVRQVAFLRRDTGFLEGFGPVAERRGRMVFTQPGLLHFDAKYTLLAVACPH